MRTLVFAKRNFKEIVRDPISLVFCIGLPLFLLVIFEQFNIPSYIYSINNFAPGIAIFGFSFISLFSGLLIANDRTSSFLTRLFASPLTAMDYIIGYSLSLLPIALLQSILFFITSFFLGLAVNINVLYAILFLIPISVLFIGIGILIGCSFSDKQEPGIASIIIQAVAFLSGMYFSVDQFGTTFKTIARILPFSYALDLTRSALRGDFSNILVPFIWVLAYTVVVLIIAIAIFNKKMVSDNK